MFLSAKKRHECIMEGIFVVSTLAICRVEMESGVVFNGRLPASRKSNSVIFA